MTCSNCGTLGPNDSPYCPQCGEPLTSTGLANRRRAEAREKKTRETELTEAVAERLVKWSKWLAAAVAIPVLLCGILLGKGYFDLKNALKDANEEIAKSVNDGKAQINQSVETTKAEYAGAQLQLVGVSKDIKQVQADVGKYKAVNSHIDELQSDIVNLQTSVIDLGHKTLKAESISTTGAGPSTISLGVVGCSAQKAKGSLISLCVEGSPLLFQSMTEDGHARPVASVSSIGFQDVSRSARPSCTEERRGTIFVQKGAPHKADSPAVCIKNDSDSYVWVPIATAN